MNEGIAVLELFIIFIDSEAKADIVSDTQAAPEYSLFMNPGFFRRVAQPQVTRNVCNNRDNHAGRGWFKYDIAHRKVVSHIMVWGIDRVRLDRLW